MIKLTSINLIALCSFASFFCTASPIKKETTSILGGRERKLEEWCVQSRAIARELKSLKESRDVPGRFFGDSYNDNYEEKGPILASSLMDAMPHIVKETIVFKRIPSNERDLPVEAMKKFCETVQSIYARVDKNLEVVKSDIWWDMSLDMKVKKYLNKKTIDTINCKATRKVAQLKRYCHSSKNKVQQCKAKLSI